MAKAGKQRREERRKAVTCFSVVIRDFLVKTSPDNNSWCAGEDPHVGNLIVFFKKRLVDYNSVAFSRQAAGVKPCPTLPAMIRQRSFS